MKPERPVQPSFSIFKHFSSLVIAAPILLAAVWLDRQPSRRPGQDAVVEGQAVRVAGSVQAWRLTAADPRFGGLSALAFDRGQLIALSDSGVVVRFAPPARPSQAMRFALRDLPGGPGSPLRKGARDSESLLADRRGRGWWVGFETIHSLWLFDRDFGRVIEHRRLDVDWPANKGGEALIGQGDAVAVLPEIGGQASGSAMVTPRWVSDATRMPDGRIVLLIRRPTPFGLRNEVHIAAGAGKPARRIVLPLGPIDNMEGIVTAPTANGGTRLWIVGDDNFRPWMRTLLVAIDLGRAD